MTFSDQKYYHFIALKEKKSNGINRCVNWLENSRAKKWEELVESRSTIFTFLPVFTKKVYSFASDYSVKIGKGSKIQCYDVWYYRAVDNTTEYLILLFPFSKLCYDTFIELNKEMEIKQWFEFASIDITKVIRLGRANQLKPQHLSKLYVSNIELTFKGDEQLNSIKLGGTDPLKSITYRSLLKAKKEILGKSAESDFEYDTENKRIVLACEIFLKENIALRAKIHVDRYGNFKFYAHKAGRNFDIIPSYIKELIKTECLTTTTIFPLDRDTSKNTF